MKPAMTPQQEKFATGNPLAAYKDLSVGDGSLIFFFWFELITFFVSGLSGLAGLASRLLLYRTIFNSTRGSFAIGRGVVLRNPKRVSLGSRVMIDDYAVVDVRGAGGAIDFGSFVTIGRFSTVTAKSARISIDDGANIGSYCRVASQSRISIGKSVLIGAYSYIGPGNHRRGEEDAPLISQEMEIRGGVEIGDYAWIGAGVTILDGVKIGAGAIIGAHSLVINDVPAGATAVGVPAKVIRT